MDNSLYLEGKSKDLFNTCESNVLKIKFKDDAVAYCGVKKALILNKGFYNNSITNYVFKYLEKNNIKTHLIKELDNNHSLIKKLDIIPLEVICRNYACGSMAKRLGLKEGTKLDSTVVELTYKNEVLGDPLINSTHVLALNIASKAELDFIYQTTLKINEILSKVFNEISIDLIDFKVEFGRDENNNLVLADEFSPDTSRLWDSKSKERLDKDRFRKDLGHVSDSYREIYERLGSFLNE